MAGIPEHLLKRAQAARDALAGKAPSAEAGESASNLPAKTSETKPAPAAPVASAPPPPPPDPSYVIAAKTRKKNSVLGDGNFKFVAALGFSLRALNQTSRKNR